MFTLFVIIIGVKSLSLRLYVNGFTNSLNGLQRVDHVIVSTLREVLSVSSMLDQRQIRIEIRLGSSLHIRRKLRWIVQTGDGS